MVTQICLPQTFKVSMLVMQAKSAAGDAQSAAGDVSGSAKSAGGDVAQNAKSAAGDAKGAAQSAGRQIDQATPDLSGILDDLTGKARALSLTFGIGLSVYIFSGLHIYRIFPPATLARSECALLRIFPLFESRF